MKSLRTVRAWELTIPQIQIISLLLYVQGSLQPLTEKDLFPDFIIAASTTFVIKYMLQQGLQRTRNYKWTYVFHVIMSFAAPALLTLVHPDTPFWRVYVVALIAPTIARYIGTSYRKIKAFDAMQVNQKI